METDAYQISSAADLTALQTQVNEKGFSYSGKWFELTKDIDLNNRPWTPIGVDADHPFSGSLNGNGKTISGLNVVSKINAAGLFGFAGGPGGANMTVKDLTVSGVNNAATLGVGGVIGWTR